MNTDTILELVLDRKTALKDLKIAQNDYLVDMTPTNFKMLRTFEARYKAYKNQIYTHENMVEMLRLLKLTHDTKTLLTSGDGLKLWLYKSKNGYPTLTLEETTEV